MALYGSVAVPLGNEAVVIVTGGTVTVIVMLREAVCELASVTVNDAAYVPASVGVPVICPVDELMDNPGGILEADHRYGGMPPVAAIVAEYGVPTVPLGNDAVVIVSSAGAPIVKLSVFDAVCGVGDDESVTVTVTVLVPAAVGVPVICPVLGLIVKFAGKPAALQVYGVVPPVAATAAL